MPHSSFRWKNHLAAFFFAAGGLFGASSSSGCKDKVAKKESPKVDSVQTAMSSATAKAPPLVMNHLPSQCDAGLFYLKMQALMGNEAVQAAFAGLENVIVESLFGASNNQSTTPSSLLKAADIDFIRDLGDIAVCGNKNWDQVTLSFT